MNKIKVFIIDTVEKEVKVQEIENELEGFYSALHCDLVEIHPVWIENGQYLIVMDEEGLFKDPLIPSIRIKGKPFVYGSVFICTEDYDELSGITDADAEMLKSKVHGGCLWL